MGTESYSYGARQVNLTLVEKGLTRVSIFSRMNEGLKGEGNHPRLLMDQCPNLEKSMEQTGRKINQVKAKTAPTVNGRPCTYRPRAIVSLMFLLSSWEGVLPLTIGFILLSSSNPPQVKANLEELIVKFMNATDTRMNIIEAAKWNNIGQLIKLVSERTLGILPSNTEVNPREHFNAISVRLNEEVPIIQEKSCVGKRRRSFDTLDFKALELS
ncbi:hypothetical protein M9H77_22837 [Catharanthus roseus]|uniref:Uncharacterized protein n=1 Tax=Catharanthus roseus TaxID=4058 RepID=A0ACC0ASI2_CATRO|nr:hypothetical protein M9H77_22837 [Catharanthus roseus]